MPVTIIYEITANSYILSGILRARCTVYKEKLHTPNSKKISRRRGDTLHYFKLFAHETLLIICCCGICNVELHNRLQWMFYLIFKTECNLSCVCRFRFCQCNQNQRSSLCLLTWNIIGEWNWQGIRGNRCSSRDVRRLDGDAGWLYRRTADVRSVGYSELFVLSREDVLAAFKDHPEAEVQVLCWRGAARQHRRFVAIDNCRAWFMQISAKRSYIVSLSMRNV